MAQYTTKLQAGLGLIEETYRLLEIWEPGMNRQALLDRSLELGCFPNITARRLRNIISEAFAVRYLIDNAEPAKHLKLFINQLSPCLLYTSPSPRDGLLSRMPSSA